MVFKKGFTKPQLHPQYPTIHEGTRGTEQKEVAVCGLADDRNIGPW